ncbi:MAG: cupin domain-containing protein [Alphaproteobacteria bacterium]
MNTAIKPQAEKKTAQSFRLRTALLKEGRTHRILASAKGEAGAMNVAIKCYAHGGENEFHTHAIEDHTFIVLQGRARFQQPDLPDIEVGRNEGVLLPAGAYYKFEAVPGEPLVLLRVGNVWQPLEGEVTVNASRRLGKNGEALHSHSAENKHVEPVAIPGAFYE